MPQTASRCQSTRAGMKNSWLANPWLTPSDLRNGGGMVRINGIQLAIGIITNGQFGIRHGKMFSLAYHRPQIHIDLWV